MARSVNVTTPSASLVWIVVPRSPPSPDEICAVTVTPGLASGLPDASWSWSTGCGSNGAPELATAPGCVTSTSLAATAVVVKVATSSGSEVATAVVP